VLSKEQADLSELGSLSGQLTLILGIGAVLAFVFVAAGTRALGKVKTTFLLLTLGQRILLRFIFSNSCSFSPRGTLYRSLGGSLSGMTHLGATKETKIHTQETKNDWKK
jgi:hypothetical protein